MERFGADREFFGWYIICNLTASSLLGRRAKSFSIASQADKSNQFSIILYFPLYTQFHYLLHMYWARE